MLRTRIQETVVRRQNTGGKIKKGKWKIQKIEERRKQD
jgi:hypothetical protein